MFIGMHIEMMARFVVRCECFKQQTLVFLYLRSMFLY
jgi:hypothetical protein